MYEQPHLQNFVTHTHYPILECRDYSYDTIITINPWLLTSPEESFLLSLLASIISELSVQLCNVSVRTSMLLGRTYHLPISRQTAGEAHPSPSHSQGPLWQLLSNSWGGNHCGMQPGGPREIAKCL